MGRRGGVPEWLQVSRSCRPSFRLALIVAAAATVLLPAGSALALVPNPPDGFEKTLVRVVRNDQLAQEPPAGVVSLGDSYSSGLGAGDADGACDRTGHAWGMGIFGDDVPASERTLLACSDASIPDVYDQLDDLEAAGGAGGRLVTVTVGGNDVGFVWELTTCFIPLWSCTRREDELRGKIEALEQPLTDVYVAIQDAAPGDVVIAGGYPLLVADPDVRSDCSALTQLLAADERRMIRRLGLALNDVVQRAADVAGVLSAGASLVEVFAGHEACANGPDDWLNGLKLGGSPSPDSADFDRWGVVGGFVRSSFHPNAAGQEGYAEAFRRVWAER